MAKAITQSPPRQSAQVSAARSRAGTSRFRPQNWLKVGDIMSRDIAFVRPDSTLVAAAKLMSSRAVSCLIVPGNKAPLGIVTEADMLRRGMAGGNDFSKVNVEHIMSSPVRSVPSDMSVMDASNIMETENIRRLVVLDGGRSVGIVTQTDMVRVLASYAVSKEVTAIMTRDVAVIDSSASVEEAAQVMASEGISCVVAMNKNNVVGIFTERDFLRRVIAMRRSPARTRLKTVMSCPVVTVYSDCSVLSAWKLLERTGIRRLVVMDDEKLVGVMTQTDILKAIKAGLVEEEQDYLRQANTADDGILVVDDQGRVSNMNRRFAQIWGIPEELTRERDTEKVTSYLVTRLDELQPFFAKIQASSLTQQEICRTLHLKDGRVLNAYSLPLTRGRTPGGRIWSFRDVTCSCN